MPDPTRLQEQLRAHGARVSAQRRPVDVDAIFAGNVPAPRRRVARRRAPVLVLVATVTLLGGLFVTVRPTGPSDDLRVQVPATQPEATGPSSQSSTYVYKSPDGIYELRGARDRSVPPSACPFAPEAHCSFTSELFENGVTAGHAGGGWVDGEPAAALAKAQSGGGATNVGWRWEVWYRARSDVARVELTVRLQDGRHVVDEVVPIDGMVGFITWTGGPQSSLPVDPSDNEGAVGHPRAFAADGSELPIECPGESC